MISQATRFHYIASDCRLRPLVRSYSLARTIGYSEFNRSWMQTLSSRRVTPRKLSLNQSRKVSLLLLMKHLVSKNAIERLLGQGITKLVKEGTYSTHQYRGVKRDARVLYLFLGKISPYF